jgi:REP element-mobilizing transposase RayT
MARLLRVEYAGACYHVINRGNYRQDLFVEEGAANAFEQVLGEAAVRFGWKLHAYVIMRNHFHLAVELGEPNLSVGMKWLQGTWARRFNGFRKIVGRPFQGRYKALLVEPGHAFAQVCHYIHLNPVRAGVVEPGAVETYRWGSLSRFLDKRGRPSWLEAQTVLSDAGELQDARAGWSLYHDYLRLRASEDPKETELIAQRMSRGWCVGSKAFREEAKQALEAKGIGLDLARYSGLGPEEIAAEKVAGWEDRLAALARAAKIDLGSLPPRKSAREKVLLAAAMKQITSVSNGWLGERLQIGKPATVSQFVRRWSEDPKRKRQLQELVSRVKT